MPQRPGKDRGKAVYIGPPGTELGIRQPSQRRGAALPYRGQHGPLRQGRQFF